jgi:hypothetical protein
MLLIVRSSLDAALEALKSEMRFTPRKLFISWTKYGYNKAEYRVVESAQIIANSGYVLYETEKGLIKKNVKQFNYYRQWTQKK